MDSAFRWRDMTFPLALAWAARHHGDRTAVATNVGSLTYADLSEQVEAFALGLDQIGIRRGDQVALWMTDSLEWMIARWAVPSLGAVLVPVNTRLKGDELRYILNQSDASTLIMDAVHGGHDYLATLSEIAPDHAGQNPGDWQTARLPGLKRAVVARASGDCSSMYSFDTILGAGADLRGDGAAYRALTDAVAPDDVAQLLYTSGTTSLPKGAMVRHGSLLENNFHSAARTAMTPDDAYLLTVPSFSASGVAACCQCLTHGAKLVLMDRFSAEGFCELVESERVTTAFFADPIVYDLRNSYGCSAYDLSSLRTGSGAPLSDSSVQYLVDELGVAELTLIYGMSETSNVISRGCSADSRDVRLRSNGPPQPDVEITIVDPETEYVLGTDEVGEIRISGYTVMPGYYDKPAETAATFDKTGRLKSGDLGMINAHGELVYVGRVKEMLKVGGFNIAPAEIEAFLESCPDVSRAAVVGVPDDRLVEVPFAFLDAAERSDLAAARIHALCRTGMASYKVPRFIAFDRDWPLTGTQKVQKSRLRERAMALIEAGSVKALN